MRLLLIRHGQTFSNVGLHLDTAAPGADLTDLGQRQAQAVPEGLAGEDVAAIYVSTLVRTQQTAAPLVAATGLEPRVRDGAREISAGDYEMRNDREAIDAYLDVVFNWAEEPHRSLPGGESGDSVLERFDSVVAEAVAEVGDGTAALFAHGAVIRVWAAARADNVDLAFAATHYLPNTGMVVLEGDPDGGWTVVEWREAPLGGPHLSDRAHSGPGGDIDKHHDAHD